MEKVNHCGEDVEVIRFVWEIHFSKKTKILISNLVCSFPLVYIQVRYCIFIDLTYGEKLRAAVTDIWRKVRS